MNTRLRAAALGARGFCVHERGAGTSDRAGSRASWRRQQSRWPPSAEPALRTPQPSLSARCTAIGLRPAGSMPIRPQAAPTPLYLLGRLPGRRGRSQGRARCRWPPRARSPLRSRPARARPPPADSPSQSRRGLDLLLTTTAAARRRGGRASARRLRRQLPQLAHKHRRSEHLGVCRWHDEHGPAEHHDRHKRDRLGHDRSGGGPSRGARLFEMHARQWRVQLPRPAARRWLRVPSWRRRDRVASVQDGTGQMSAVHAWRRSAQPRPSCIRADDGAAAADRLMHAPARRPAVPGSKEHAPTPVQRQAARLRDDHQLQRSDPHVSSDDRHAIAGVQPGGRGMRRRLPGRSARPLTTSRRPGLPRGHLLLRSGPVPDASGAHALGERRCRAGCPKPPLLERRGPTGNSSVSTAFTWL